jgi:hypothetical protein
MSTRRDFMRSALVAGAALGLGLWRGWETAPATGTWDLVVRAPRGEEDAVAGLAARLGLDCGQDAWVPLPMAGPADLVLLRGGRLLDPAQWPTQALELRGAWRGRTAGQMLRLQGKPSAPATRALVWGPQGLLARLDLDRTGETLVTGRDGRRLVLDVRNGGVAVVESACRHGHCRRQGQVSRWGERLVCAPAGLLVQLEA